MKVKSIVGWLCSAALCVVYTLLLTVHACGSSLYDESMSRFMALSAVSLVVLLGGCLSISRVCRRRGVDLAGYWRGTLIILLIIPIASLMIDAPPLEQDYGLQDIISSNPEVLASYDTLMLLRNGGELDKGTSSIREIYCQLQTNVTGYSEEIYKAWDEIAEERAIIEKLDTYPGIADCTPDTVFGIDTPTPSYVAIRSIAQTYAAYARLKTAEGNPEEAVAQLATLHRVTRKTLPHAALLVTRMIWINVANSSMETARDILLDSHSDADTWELLQEGFPSIPEEHVSLQRSLIGEYLNIRAICNDYIQPNTFLDVFSCSADGDSADAGSGMRKAISSVAFHLSFRRNRTVRDLRELLDIYLDGAGKRPPDMSEADSSMESYCSRADIRNLGGWLVVSVAIPSYEKACDTSIRVKVLSDLLAVEIGARLKESTSLKDYYSGEPYRSDVKTGQPFSVGPDMLPGTKDDIALGRK